MDTALDHTVRTRAGHRCEYCHVPQSLYQERFQIDHVIARQHGGLTMLSNLALACMECNRRKGPNLSGIDPESQTIMPLFNPRSDRWSDHFIWHGALVIGRSPRARATIAVLDINRATRVAVREAFIEEGFFPPDGDPISPSGLPPVS